MTNTFSTALADTQIELVRGDDVLRLALSSWTIVLALTAMTGRTAPVFGFARHTITPAGAQEISAALNAVLAVLATQTSPFAVGMVADDNEALFHIARFVREAADCGFVVVPSPSVLYVELAPVSRRIEYEAN